MAKYDGFQYGEQKDENGLITTVGSWAATDSPKTSLPIIIENLRSLKDDFISSPATHSHSSTLKLASTANIVSLIGLLVVDDVQTVDGDRVLVKNQTNTTQNGPYIVHETEWIRATVMTLFNAITNGTVNSGKTYSLITADPFIIGTTPILYQTDAVRGLGAGEGITIESNLINLSASGIIPGSYSLLNVNVKGVAVSGGDYITFSSDPPIAPINKQLWIDIS